MRLEGQIAIITGAGQGNGAAIARGLAAEGACVVVTDLDPETATHTAREISQAGGAAHAWALDVTDANACGVLAETVLQKVGDVTVLVNNAGICPRHPHDRGDTAGPRPRCPLSRPHPDGPLRRAGGDGGPVVFLASAMSSYVTGTTLVVDGGYLAV